MGTIKNPEDLPSAAEVRAAVAPDAHAQRLIDAGLAYLKAQQSPDGSWGGEKAPPALTAIVLKAFVQDGQYDATTEFVKRGYDKLLTHQVDNGGIYRDLLANYNTAIAVSALAAADRPEYRDEIDKAVAYLKGLQWTPETRPEFDDASKGQQVVKDEKDPFYGGWGYGGRSRGAGRPDLSNVQMTMDALHDAGLKPGDPAYDRAIAFVTRTQNRSESNDQAWAGNDGGFVYGPAADRQGESMAGEYTAPDGRRLLRSYGSMTYAGLKSFMYAGLGKDDPRVQAAWDWITKNWTLDENPGMRQNKPDQAQSGLYYYYHTLARALHAYGQPTITDPQGQVHDWRTELINKVASLQRPDGSWAGDKRWMEDNPILVTSYVVLALQEAQQDLKARPAQSK
ncbi:MAG TPA: prenyltransferase/squalene oxidase repeat-containing protein [Tepidisphaeraceae bacterium]|nr:prenyltransferase/squalene oxidase repeat-containing protein [Tepidisphaeraceae bacterium]